MTLYIFEQFLLTSGGVCVLTPYIFEQLLLTSWTTLLVLWKFYGSFSDEMFVLTTCFSLDFIFSLEIVCVYFEFRVWIVVGFFFLAWKDYVWTMHWEDRV